jgi:hypothetical protein
MLLLMVKEKIPVPPLTLVKLTTKFLPVDWQEA